jgi:alkylation response protein AidB-like acyl-CoA dehydrogenase
MDDGKPRMTEHGPDILHVWMPTNEITIHDTWHVSGLCGTGSNDVSAAGVFVPERRTFRLLDPSGHRPEPLYQTPPITQFVYQLVGVSLGIARAALDEFTELAQSKVPTMYQNVLADKAMVQVELARAEASLGSARAFVYEVLEEMWDTVTAGRAPSARQVAIARAAAIHAIGVANTVAGTVNTLAGGSSIYTKSSLQRHARDAEAVTHHFTVAPHVWEEAGRVLLGRTPIVPAF